MKPLLIITIFAAILSSKCGDDGDLLGYDIRLFRGVAWELAKAVEEEDTLKIEKIIKRGKTDVDIREPKFGQTLLLWAVSQNKYLSAVKLLEMGANPNLGDTYDGTSAVIAAADKRETSKYLKLVLKYGGDPNSKANTDQPVFNQTPLAAAAKNRLESVKILLEAGADLNFGYEDGKTALVEAVLLRQVDIVHYLLLEKNAEFDKPVQQSVDGTKTYIVDFMRYWAFPLDSEQYKLKMEIVDYLKARGMDYWQTRIPLHIGNNYPEEYLKKY